MKINYFPNVKQAVDIPPDRKLVLDVPPNVPEGRVIITYAPDEVTPWGTPFGTPVFGCLKGQIWMSDDFDAPLEEFKDYM
ncbi:hypothetical protein R80B4_00219 [Fibrobacteres bacterium R8-0-B4]